MMDSDHEDFSGSDSDDDFKADMEALRNACILTSKCSGDEPSPPSEIVTVPDEPLRGGSRLRDSDSDTDSAENDLELVRNIQRQFGISATAAAVDEPLTLQPLRSLPPFGFEDDYEDDYEAIQAIQRRFAAYNADVHGDITQGFSHKADQVGATNVASEKETSDNLFVERTNLGEGFPNSVDANNGATINSEVLSCSVSENQSSDLIVWHSGATNECGSPARHSGLPKSAKAVFDVIKKNRSYQKFLRSKLVQIESRIAENEKLKERVKTLKDFQVSCRKRTGRALSQKKDARALLISVPKPRANAKDNDKKVPAMYYGPPENSHVTNYRMVLEKYPLSLSREKWSKKERKKLAEGIKQQFQEMLFKKSVDQFGGSEGSLGDINGWDNILASISNLDITPEKIRLFVHMRKVNWEQLSKMHIPSRSGAECEARWLNCEDSLINRYAWTNEEDKKLLHIVQEKGIDEWIDTAASLGTNRTPFQCLARYQRSLNVSIMKREWTKDEDDKLRAAIKAFGDTNWQVIASTMVGRTGPQCSNRWKKSLHPARERKGKWTPDEDKRMKVAVMLFGPKTWRKVAKFVPGRTDVQCRERWVNCLDPALNLGKWTGEEDLRLEDAIDKYGYCWSKVAACVPPRTDNQCRRRWQVLRPHEVPLLQEARKTQKAALISNFVDRESERPALGPGDFIALPEINAICESGNLKLSGKQKGRSRCRSKQRDQNVTSSCLEEVPLLTYDDEIETITSENAIPMNKGVMKRCSKNKKSVAQTQDQSASCSDGILATISDIEKVDGCDTKKKKTTRQKRKSASCDPTKVHISSKDSSLLAMVLGEELEEFYKNNVAIEPCKDVAVNAIESEILVQDSDISGKKGRKPKLQPRMKRDTAPIQDQSYLPPSTLWTDTGEAAPALGEIDVRKNRCILKTKSRSENTEFAVISQNPLSTPANFEMTAASADCIDSFVGNSVVRNEDVEVEVGSELSPTCFTPDILDTGNHEVSTICQQNRCKKSSTKGRDESHQKDEDNMTLASFLIQAATSAKSTLSSANCGKLCSKNAGKTKIVEAYERISLSMNCSSSVNPDGASRSGSGSDRHFHPKKSRKRNRNCSKVMSKGNDGDDITIASFCKILKKRKIPHENQTNG